MRKHRRAPFALLALGLLAWLLAASSCSSPDGPSQSVQLFYERLNAGDYAGARALYTSEARQVFSDPTIGEAGFAEWARAETRDGQVKRIQITRSETNDTAATVEYDVLYQDGSSKRGKVTLTLENGQWKMGLVG